MWIFFIVQTRVSKVTRIAFHLKIALLFWEVGDLCVFSVSPEKCFDTSFWNFLFKWHPYGNHNHIKTTPIRHHLVYIEVSRLILLDNKGFLERNTGHKIVPLSAFKWRTWHHYLPKILYGNQRRFSCSNLLSSRVPKLAHKGQVDAALPPPPLRLVPVYRAAVGQCGGGRFSHAVSFGRLSQQYTQKTFKTWLKLHFQDGRINTFLLLKIIPKQQGQQ